MRFDRYAVLARSPCQHDRDFYHVSARFDGDVGIMIMGQEKQPFEELEARKSYELVLITHNGSASKFRIVTEWTDLSGNQHTKTQMGDFS